MGFRGAIFDVDGVLVDSPHEQAWREGMQQLMENEWGDVRDQTSYAPEKFTPEVYPRVMSGMPRYDGARADDEELLADVNADLVVTSLDDVSLDALAEGRLERKDK
jgi:beta-phosphoglucomutase-like phosphatase (HAD superfamily)